jgi:predicted GIY-YIG superfamily endonuclease
MKKHYVYSLTNLSGQIEYIGESKNLKGRMSVHLSKNSRFYKRTDLTMNVIKEFDNKSEAKDYQYELQKQYGFETDRERYTKICLNNADKLSNKVEILNYDTKELLFISKSITQCGKDLGLNTGIIFKRLKNKEAYIVSPLYPNIKIELIIK